jgi:hypothetical protein
MKAQKRDEREKKIGKKKYFTLAYMRHTGQWWEVYQGLTVEEYFETIVNQQTFWP